MATKSYTLPATAGNDNKTINEPNSVDQWKYVWDGLAGVDSLSFDRLPQSQFTIYKNATGIHVDSVSTASHMIYVTLNNVETLKFSNGATTVDLTALFETTPPTLLSASPADEAVGVPLASNLLLTFSETVKRGTGNIVLRNAAGTVIETYNAATSSNLSVSGAVVTVNPTANLSVGTTYYLELAAGTVTDAAGNAYAGTQIYNFTTVSNNNLPTGSVSITGTATQGQQLTASNTLADADGLGTISYQWKAAGTAISGATSSTYTLTQAEVGKAITVTASYNDVLGTAESKTSTATAAVANVNDLPTGSVSITGTATQGQQLTASHSLADADGLGTISYQWKAAGTAISGATSSTYTLTQAEVGKAITVTASYNDVLGTAESKTSTATAAVANVNDLPTGSVSITGTATQGQQLTASHSLADADGLGTISYQWKAAGTAISGATSSTYTLTQAEVGKAITVTASYNDVLGTAESKTSTATAAVANVNDLPTGGVSITGTATQGQQLTASHSLADADGLGTISYQWKAAGTAISGATSSTYTLTQAEVGKAITVTASYNDVLGTAESKTSTATAAVANVNDLPTGSVSITGTATQGQQLTASHSLADADGLGTISYQWKAAGTAISGATSSTYTLTQAEVGKAITVTASYNDVLGTAESKTSTATAAVANVNDLPTGGVSITGTATQGQQLTASHTLADADGLGTISYQWKAAGTAISGATSSTYTLTQAEVGKAITVTASYNDVLGTAESKTSTATAAVVNVNDLPTGGVSITGTATQGQQLTASHTLADADGLGTISYQWKAAGTAISGATSSTYTLTQAEVGKAITVTASYNDVLGTAESKTSTATAAVANVNDLPTGSVSITGTATQGRSLTASHTLADADGLGTISYQWKAAGTAISGATLSTYTLTQAEVGKAITVTASYIDALGAAESVNSSATDPVTQFNNAPTGSVTVSGTATQGQQLSASHTLADADGLGTVSYQWKAAGTAISGATSSTYTLTQAEVGKAITVTASYVDLAGKQEAVSSSSTAAVANVNDLPTGSVSITGTATQGQQLTASHTLADADGLGTVSYQWKAAGTAISGATSSTYTLTQAEVGKAITVTASYNDVLGTAESKTSTATAAVANVNDLPTGSVSITGTATQGQQLTASHTLADADGLGTISYQWKAAGTAISGATLSTYTLTQAEVGKAITVTASYNDVLGTAESKTSTATAAVANVNDLPTGGVSITGTATQGQQLTASHTLADADGLGTVSYQWKAAGTAISGATSSTYTLTQAEVGKAITVTASYNDVLGTAESKTSTATAAVVNVNDLPTGSVSITGTATQGQQLTASNTLADADGLGTISYQWKAAGTAISGATSSTYTLTQAEVGKAITVTASYMDGLGASEAVSSSATDRVAEFNNAPTGSVTVSGTATQGQQLSASHTLADADGLGTVSYQWKAAGTAISGATSSTYTLTQAEVGKAITVTASYNDVLGTAESKTSTATAAVANVNDLPTGSVSITGTATQGQQLTASHTLADADGLGTISYQWKAAGTAISGATSSTYTLTQAEVGKAITVTASYNDVLGTAESKTSTATAAVVNVNDRPEILGSDSMLSVILGVSNAIGALSLVDADDDVLSLSLFASEGDLFLLGGMVDADLDQAGVQWTGSVAELNAALEKLHFAPTSTSAALTVEVSDAHAASDRLVYPFVVNVPTNYNSQDGDADGISTTVELAVPGLSTGSTAGMTGDGNGDGVLDVFQANVSSALLQILDGSGTSSQAYATLVAGSQLGKADEAAGLVITSLGQDTNLQDLPVAMHAPMGKFEFTAELATLGETAQFSIYVDESLGVNGYWKATPEGTWVNLASALYGGQTVAEGGYTRLDFSITDGGLFDDDHSANGQIHDPGVVGALTVSLIDTHPHPVFHDFWF